MWNPVTREARSQSRSRRVKLFLFVGQEVAHDRFNERIALISLNDLVCQPARNSGRASDAATGSFIGITSRKVS